MPTEVRTPKYPGISSSGSPLPDPVAQKLLDLEIESTYNRPDVCFLTFDIDANTEFPSQLDLGKPLDVSFRGEQGTIKVFQGEITALEYDSTQNRSVVIVQAEDKFHRLFRGDNCRTFLEKTVSEAVKEVISGSGVPVGSVQSTSSKHPFQMQQNVSDGVFVLERARELGFHVRAKDGRIFWGKVGDGGDSGVQLELKKDLLTFNCRATATTFLKEAKVHSWDVKEKKPIEVQVTSNNFTGRADSSVKSAFDHPKLRLSRSDLGSVDEAKASAQAAMDRANELNLQAEGTCHGDGRLAVDKEVTIKGVNKRFDGKYRISHIRHRYAREQGYTTEFSCRGVSDQSLSALVSESAAASGTGPDRSVFDGVTVGIVTDNKDPDDLGRVMVRIPSLHEQHTTHWVRVMQPGAGGAGGHHGWYLLPEKDDEVLVAFEQGDAKRGYVLGGLLNGKEKPFYKKDKVLSGTNVNQHAFRLKSGAHLLFDEKDKAEVIEIKNKDGCFTFSFTEEKGVEIKHSAKGEKFLIDNKGDITIKSTNGNITIEAPMGALTLKAQKDISIESQTGKVSIKAATDASVEGGTNAKLKGNASAEVSGAQAKLEGTATATVKGAMVMIN